MGDAKFEWILVSCVISLEKMLIATPCVVLLWSIWHLDLTWNRQGCPLWCLGLRTHSASVCLEGATSGIFASKVGFGADTSKYPHVEPLTVCASGGQEGKLRTLGIPGKA